MTKNNLAALYILGFILAVALAGMLTVGFTGALFSITFIGGFILWILTTYRHPIDPNNIMKPYLLTVIAFILHVYEEYRTHIEQLFSTIVGMPITQENFLGIAAFAGPVVWLLGAFMMLNRWQFGYFLASTFLFGMMFGELSHFLFPFLEDGTFHYASGMYTAILPILAGWYTFLTLRRESRKQER
jgi:hypothetical protein